MATGDKKRALMSDDRNDGSGSYGVLAAPLNTSSPTSLTGVLMGDGSVVGTKTLDTSSLTNDNNHIPTSGVVKSALDAVINVFTGDITTEKAPTDYKIGLTVEGAAAGVVGPTYGGTLVTFKSNNARALQLYSDRAATDIRYRTATNTGTWNAWKVIAST